VIHFIHSTLCITNIVKCKKYYEKAAEDKKRYLNEKADYPARCKREEEAFYIQVATIHPPFFNTECDTPTKNLKEEKEKSAEIGSRSTST
jgi:hypothetical protein